MTNKASTAVQTAVLKTEAPCVQNLPFCGLGDTKCLASRIATCSGMSLVEQPLAQHTAKFGATVRS